MNPKDGIACWGLNPKDIEKLKIILMYVLVKAKELFNPPLI